MRRTFMRCALLLAALMCTARAHADTGSPPTPVAVPSPAAPPARTPARGFAVLAQGSVLDAAWPLAKALYAREALRPQQVDEAHARVLAGEPAPADAPSDLRDLAETRAAVHGDDAPSRQRLSSIATTLGLRGIVVVEMSPSPSPQAPAAVRARLFLADSGFDAASYAADSPDTRPDELAAAKSSGPQWTGAVRSLERAHGMAPIVPVATPASARLPALSALPEQKGEGQGRAFYASPWFWGAAGAAVLAGGAVFLATRDNTPSTIHLQLQVPK